jgi:hypothetical protein
MKVTDIFVYTTLDAKVHNRSILYICVMLRQVIKYVIR